MLFGGSYSDSSDDDACEETIGDCVNAVDNSDIDIDDSEDPLRHAGAYTAEEITLITRDKLIQLQSLYVEYLQLLKRRYGRKRAEFHKRVKAEKDTVGPLWASANTPRQKMKLEQLAACRRYHRRFGEEALLYQQSQKRRRLAAGTPNATDNESVHLCNALVNGMDCGEMALPNSSMCARHIMCDGKQVLFFKCEVEECRNVCIPASDIKHCWYHQRPPEGVRHQLNVPWAAFNQLKPALPAANQRSSVFASSASALRVFPTLSTSDASTTTASAAQKSVNARYTKKRLGNAQGHQGPVRKVPAVARLGQHPLQAPLNAAELRSAPPIQTNKVPSFDDVSADAGVYGAYMTTAEPAEGGQENAPSTPSAAGKQVKPNDETSNRASI